MPALSIPVGSGQADGSHVNVAGDSVPRLQLSDISVAVYPAAQSGMHVPLSGIDVMFTPQDSAAALSMPTGGVQGNGSHVKVAGDSVP